MIPNPLHRFALLPCLAVLLGTSCQFVSGYGDLDKADHNPTTGGASSVGGLGGVGGVSGGTGGVGGTGGSIGGSGGGGFAGTGGLGGSGGDGTGGLGGIGGLGGGGGSVVALADNEDYPLRLAVDDTHVYWTCFAFPGAIRKVPIQGGTPVDLAVDQNHPKGLVVDSTHVYWTNSGDGTVRRVLKSGAGGAGGGSTTLYEHAGGGPAAGPAGIALDDSGRLLWTTFNLGTVEKDNKTGLNHATMVSGLSQPVGIVAYGANHSYWANHGSGVGGNGSIWELKFGGIPVYGPVVSGLAGPWDIAVTANGQLVWINNGVGPLTLHNTIVARNDADDISGGWSEQSSHVGGNPGFVRDPSPGQDGIWGTGVDDYGDLRLRSIGPAVPRFGGSPALRLARYVRATASDSNAEGASCEVKFDETRFVRFGEEPDQLRAGGQ